MSNGKPNKIINYLLRMNQINSFSYSSDIASENLVDFILRFEVN